MTRKIQRHEREWQCEPWTIRLLAASVVLEVIMILDALVGVCFFAAVAAILTVPWMGAGPAEKH